MYCLGHVTLRQQTAYFVYVAALFIFPPCMQVYDKCFLGSSPAATPDTVFQGQMAAVYLFGEPLSSGTVAALHKLGPTYKVR